MNQPAQPSERPDSASVSNGAAERRVQVQGRSSDLEHLARHFGSDRVRVHRDDRDGAFTLAAGAFAACVSAEEVLRIGGSELRVLSGPALRDRFS
jgi:hypothetical protein